MKWETRTNSAELLDRFSCACYACAMQAEITELAMTKSTETLTTVEAGKILNRHKMTVTRWCIRGMFEGAYQDGPFPNSPWVIPAESVEKVRKSFQPQ